MSTLISVPMVDVSEQLEGDNGGVIVHKLEPGEMLISIGILGTVEKLLLETINRQLKIKLPYIFLALKATSHKHLLACNSILIWRTSSSLSSFISQLMKISSSSFSLWLFHS